MNWKVHERRSPRGQRGRWTPHLLLQHQWHAAASTGQGMMSLESTQMLCLLAQQQEGCWSAAVSTLQPLPKSLPLPSVLYEGKSSVAAGTAQSWWLPFMEEQEMAGVPPPAGRGSIWMSKVRSHTIPCCTALEESSKGAIKCCATIVPLDTPIADVHLPCTCGKQLYSWFPDFLLPTKRLLPMGRLEKPKSSAEAVRRQRATPQASYLQREKSKSCSLKRLQDAGVVERGSLHRTAQQQAALGNSAHGTGMFLITPALNRLQDCKLLGTLCPLNWPSAEGLQEKSYGTELQPPDSRVFRKIQQHVTSKFTRRLDTKLPSTVTRQNVK